MRCRRGRMCGPLLRLVADRMHACPAPPSPRQSGDDASDDEDETAELMRELERIKKEREEDAARKASEDKARTEAEKKDAMLRGNPLLAGGGFSVKRRWDDDVVFRNQARTEPAAKKVRAPILRLLCLCVALAGGTAPRVCMACLQKSLS